MNRQSYECRQIWFEGESILQFSIEFSSFYITGGNSVAEIFNLSGLILSEWEKFTERMNMCGEIKLERQKHDEKIELTSWLLKEKFSKL